MRTSTMTLRIENTVKIRLEKLAELTHRSKSFLAADAINKYLELQEWQINEIKKGIAEADAGDLVDHSSIVNYWEKKRANSLDKKS